MLYYSSRSSFFFFFFLSLLLVVVVEVLFLWKFVKFQTGRNLEFSLNYTCFKSFQRRVNVFLKTWHGQLSELLF